MQQGSSKVATVLAQRRKAHSESEVYIYPLMYATVETIEPAQDHDVDRLGLYVPDAPFMPRGMDCFQVERVRVVRSIF